MASESETEKRETLADIVSEIRAYGAQPPPRLMWLEIADRIEAAWKREREELREAATEKMLEGATIIDNRGHGNAAAMRKALVELTDKVLDYLHRGLIQLPLPLEDATAKARASLSAPPRNCDLPLVVDGPANNNADKAWLVFKYRNPDAYFGVSGLLRCIDWLLSPAAEKQITCIRSR